MGLTLNILNFFFKSDFDGVLILRFLMKFPVKIKGDQKVLTQTMIT